MDKKLEIKHAHKAVRATPAMGVLLEMEEYWDTMFLKRSRCFTDWTTDKRCVGLANVSNVFKATAFGYPMIMHAVEL